MFFIQSINVKLKQQANFPPKYDVTDITCNVMGGLGGLGSCQCLFQLHTEALKESKLLYLQRTKIKHPVIITI